MPKALVTGGNSKFGKAFVKELSKSHDVVVIPRRHLLSEQIYKYKGQYDIILLIIITCQRTSINNHFNIIV